ncbi:hypothetical protein MYCTH_2296708 [Thermothelomyces thermophilus ATCC 42464]|uniref:Uncharacterized protein n=1 Tax=Thermothelomyces thermophilus (strain ATCC 42464 / BCRC 31852 / DSM 1799) TaxID=573729 RepID=G2Q2S0_THET4|nr:uncharacterized protein MYCTH_2296708 [Thermothelomyces thermophilus ATCC 42464]AEO54287.1 hypothetical protein MYCTH_2296708 [Thermothelomyces thermophilus ATCC 42464]
MTGYFFTSWELWEEMTFVLAMGIVSVFCAGLVKLWWNNRLMKKEERLDAEKRARVEEMRKSGIPIKRANAVPFGVRAIQSGVEVEGIWISRPASLNELGEKLTSSTTLAGGRDSDSQKKGQISSEDEKPVRVTTTANLGSKQSQSTASVLQKLTDAESMDSSSSAAPPRLAVRVHQTNDALFPLPGNAKRRCPAPTRGPIPLTNLDLRDLYTKHYYQNLLSTPAQPPTPPQRAELGDILLGGLGGFASPLSQKHQRPELRLVAQRPGVRGSDGSVPTRPRAAAMV